MLRRQWKKLNDKDVSGRRSRLANMIAAFKMGLYVKVFITLILLLRFASHSSQRSYPTGSHTPDDHFAALSATPVSPSLRIIVLSHNGYSQNIPSLLSSLAAADYDRDTVALDVWMFASSTCDYLPLPIYPLGMAVFGPPRFDHSITPLVHAASWPHGEKTLIATRNEPDWPQLWHPTRGTANESLVFFDASVATHVSPAFYIWLKRVRLATGRGMISNAGVLALDAVTVPDTVPTSDRAVLLEQFFPATAAFSPTQDVWGTFLKWHAMRTKTWFARPALANELALGGYDWVDSLRADPTRAWFAQFLAAYKERVVYPALPNNQTLVVRNSGTTGAKVAGTGGKGRIHIHRLGEVDTNLFQGSLKDVVVPERPVLVKADAGVATADAEFGNSEGKVAGVSRGARIEDLVGAAAASKYRDVLRRIGEFARSRGTQSISLTLTTGSFVDTTLSWLCNVVHLDIAPPAIVIVVSNDKVEDALNKLIGQHPRLEQGSMVISMQGALKAVAYASSPDAALHFGSSEYWMLMMQRTFLIRDLVEHGMSMLNFETDQIWFKDPMPYIERELQGDRGHGADEEMEAERVADMVMTVNTKGEVAGNFFYLRASIRTRMLLSTVVDRFFLSYRGSLKGREAKENKFHYIENDQSLLTQLVLQQDLGFAQAYPPVKHKALNREVFVDGTWFLDFEDEKGNKVDKRTNYTSEMSLYPVVLNNNFLIGVEEKMKRAQRFGLWFLKRSAEDLSPVCDVEAVRKAAKSGSDKEGREEAVVEIGRKVE